MPMRWVLTGRFVRRHHKFPACGDEIEVFFRKTTEIVPHSPYKNMLRKRG